MAKFLLFIAVVAVIWFVVRASNRRAKSSAAPPESTSSQAMVRCGHCGVHFPRAEALSRDGRDYCCENHRRLGGDS